MNRWQKGNNAFVEGESVYIVSRQQEGRIVYVVPGTSKYLVVAHGRFFHVRESNLTKPPKVRIWQRVTRFFRRMMPGNR